MKSNAYYCHQGGIVCSPHGHRAFTTAALHSARLNRALQSIGLLTDATRWTPRSTAQQEQP